MDERWIVCSRCDNDTLMIRDDIPSGWIFVETGWAEINHQAYCPKCKERYLKHRLVIGECARKYPDLIMYPCE